jgi:hypothetical protein
MCLKSVMSRNTHSVPLLSSDKIGELIDFYPMTIYAKQLAKSGCAALQIAGGKWLVTYFSCALRQVGDAIFSLAVALEINSLKLP